jgi:hypothetical protein
MTRRAVALVAAMATTASLAWALPADAAGPAANRTVRLAATTTTTASTTAATSTATAAAVGKLTPRGCASGTGTATCDLYAMAGTNSVLGTPIPIWGFSTSAAAGTATAPGPLLVVRQGDTVSITLHNQLAGQAVSLALPGQAAGSFSGIGANDTTGVGTGGTRTYTFTADRPGTFSYQAGHTPNGARQLIMGLGGALVVLPADGTAYGTSPGMPATSYADEAVLVLSEIDPAFNADPAGFDLRGYQPKYRLINGKPYPSTDPIPTDQGHTVLLRYINIGAQTHAMGVLGSDQLEVAEDAHQLKYQMRVTADSVVPGQSRDALVVMPTGPESKVAVYEPSGHLDNNGQTTGDPQELATGGMLTFLDTNAPAPSTDGIGPVSTHITASPNPSDARTAVTITADLSDLANGGSNVTQAEFVVDDAVTTGVGFGRPMTGAFGTVTVTGAHATIPVTATPCSPPSGPPPVSLNCLSAGKHKIYVRALDSAGNWGVIGSVIFNLPKTGPATTGGSITSAPTNGSADAAISATGDDSAAGGNITRAEYFVDTVGTAGTGTALSLNRAATVVSEDGPLPAARIRALTEGLHHVFVRSFDTLALWGPVLDIPFVVDFTGPKVDAASVGPNPTNGVLSDKSNPGYLVISAQITDRDAGGAAQSRLNDAEAFLDPASATPAVGTGLQLVAFDGKMDSTTEAVYGLIPISQISSLSNGQHHVYVRGQDAAGNWGTLLAVNLVVDKTAPVLGTLSAAPNPTNGASTVTLSAAVTDASLIAAAEYWRGTTDPGVGAGSSVPVSTVGGRVIVQVPMAGVPLGAQRFNLRVMDLAGNWSNVVFTTVTVQRANLIFNNKFETSDYGLWNGRIGNVSNPTTAVLPSTRETGSTRGLQVLMPGGTANVASYVRDTSPSAETSYHVRFQFRANTLTAGTDPALALTLLDARTAANGQVFRLQYQFISGTARIRLVLMRTTGVALAGSWVTLTAATHSIRMDWVAATSGSVGLMVDGTTRSTLTGSTSTLRVETVLLGVSAGYSTTSTGKTAGRAYFDTFESVRNALP